MMFVALMLMALAAPSPQSLDFPRRTYSACVRQFETKSLAAKLDVPAYSIALKGACTAEGAALAKALTEYDVAMGGKRGKAAASANIDVADYRSTSEERFRDTLPKPE